MKQLVGSLCKRHAVTPSRVLRPLASAQFQVLFHSPSRGASHLSLTVLVRYRSSAVFSLAGWSPRIRTGFHVPRPTQVPAKTSARRPYGGLTLCAHTFQDVPVSADVTKAGPTTPASPRTLRFRLLPLRSPLLRESTIFFLLLRVLRCFSSPGSPQTCVWRAAFSRAGCPIRKRPDQILFADPRTFSQLTASFIACRSQGILCAL